MNNYYVAMRQESIKRYYRGESPKSIYASLGRSKKWFFKWLKRHKEQTTCEWYLDKSRARKAQIYALTGHTKDAIVKKRKELESSKYQQIGACKIRMELKKADIYPLPQVWQINRVLQRNKLTHPKGPYKSKGKVYPSFTIDRPGLVHQADYACVRKIKNEGIVRALNNVDSYSRSCCVNIIRTKQARATIGAFISTWKRIGLPVYLQLDNDRVFQEGSYTSEALSRVLRLILHLHIEVIFIPPREPWRNCYVESFNGIYKYKFFNSQIWADISHIRREAAVFENIYNDSYCCSARSGHTPNEVVSQYPINYLPADYKVPEQIPYPHAGKIHFIRFIRSDRKIRIFNDEFKLKDSVVYEYVKATLDIKEGALFIYYQDNLMQGFKYKTNTKTRVYITSTNKSEGNPCGATVFCPGG